jgi:hypothetical protein
MSPLNVKSPDGDISVIKSLVPSLTANPLALESCKSLSVLEPDESDTIESRPDTADADIVASLDDPLDDTVSDAAPPSAATVSDDAPDDACTFRARGPATVDPPTVRSPTMAVAPVDGVTEIKSFELSLRTNLSVAPSLRRLKVVPDVSFKKTSAFIPLGDVTWTMALFAPPDVTSIDDAESDDMMATLRTPNALELPTFRLPRRSASPLVFDRVSKSTLSGSTITKASALPRLTREKADDDSARLNLLSFPDPAEM